MYYCWFLEATNQNWEYKTFQTHQQLNIQYTDFKGQELDYYKYLECLMSAHIEPMNHFSLDMIGHILLCNSNCIHHCLSRKGSTYMAFDTIIFNLLSRFARFVKGIHDFEKLMLEWGNIGNYIPEGHCHKVCHHSQLGLLAIKAYRSIKHCL